MNQETKTHSVVSVSFRGGPYESTSRRVPIAPDGRAPEVVLLPLELREKWRGEYRLVSHASNVMFWDEAKRLMGPKPRYTGPRAKITLRKA